MTHLSDSCGTDIADERYAHGQADRDARQDEAEAGESWRARRDSRREEDPTDRAARRKAWAEEAERVVAEMCGRREP